MITAKSSSIEPAAVYTGLVDRIDPDGKAWLTLTDRKGSQRSAFSKAEFLRRHGIYERSRFIVHFYIGDDPPYYWCEYTAVVDDDTEVQKQLSRLSGRAPNLVPISCPRCGCSTVYCSVGRMQRCYAYRSLLSGRIEGSPDGTAPEEFFDTLEPGNVLLQCSHCRRHWHEAHFESAPDYQI